MNNIIYDGGLLCAGQLPSELRLFRTFNSFSAAHRLNDSIRSIVRAGVSSIIHPRITDEFTPSNPPDLFDELDVERCD